ncbi:LytR C-terminal domain-containing protein [Mycobacterium vicinigordonae]|uniref:LytR C-terminal domain-containing protein n=1 Tax=Mycobacterium vicinigordonae TaxID=1719132 RepID=A0A7D6I9P3_9MYCO|nr:LytR C-terminal domain-containing protein [Mycobacterium vicinigordonae]QLL08117.1 LytR C-terminal domain-containing protein [Mycobacterium vicinigordonae]
MNERVPDSSGLPLRAMVMVLLFLGVIFLLLGWQALGSSGKSDDESSPATTASSTAAPTSTSSKAPAADAEVRVYNISSKEGIAKSTADELKAAGFKVTDVTNLSISDVAATTVYYGEESEKSTADAVGKKLGAPVEKRIPALADQPPGVIVLVTG